MLKKIIKKRAYEGNKIEDNLLFVTLQTQIVGLDMNNGYKQIFLSDKLSNMCNFYYDKDTKQLLVYNTSDMPICTRCRKESACRKNFICGQ